MTELRDIIEELLRALVSRTNDGTLEWEWDKGSGTATLDSGFVTVSKDRDYDTVIEFEDEDEVVVETINVGYQQYKYLTTLADNLYESARRSALGVHSKLSAMLEEVSDA